MNRVITAHLFAFLILLSPATLIAQDSLWSAWTNPELSDSLRLNALGKFAYDHVLNVDPDSALMLGRMLAESAYRSGHPKQEGFGHFIQGWSLIYIGRSETALNAFRIADSIASLTHDQNRGAVLNGWAVAATILGETERAIALYEECIRHHERTGNKRHLAKTWSNLGNLHWRRGDLRQAMDLFLKAIHFHESQGDSSSMIFSLNGLGTIHQVLGDRTEAKRYYERSLQLAEKAGNDRETASALSNLGVLHTELKDYDAALTYFQRTLAIQDQLLDTIGIARTYNSMGAVHGERGDLDTALMLFERCVGVLGPRAVNGDLGQALMNISAIHRKQGRLREARVAGERALAIADQVNDLHLQQKVNMEMSAIYSTTGQHKLAYDALSKAYMLRDSLSNAENQRHLVQQEFQFAYEKQAQADSLKHITELAVLDGKRHVAEVRSMALGGAGLLLLVGGSLWLRTDRRRRKERFEREAAQLETQALRSQMNPHFIFNALNSIHAYIQQQDPDRASSFVTKFARVMRSVLENSRHAEVPLRDDLDTLKAYMDLERQRSGAFDYSVEVDPEVDQDEVLVPPLVVQPFVENAIWHGMAGKEGKGHITLRVERRGGQLTYIIQDDGVGRKAAPPTPQGRPIKKTSLGTAITRSRLDLVRKQHGGTAGFRYVEQDVGTRVEVDMPLLTAG